MVWPLSDKLPLRVLTVPLTALLLMVAPMA
jgi:hypothetical protein